MKKNRCVCQVCFFECASQSITNQIINCKGCKKSAHRYCYLPNCQDKYFVCDTCQEKTKNKVCYFCSNQGLLKRTQQGQYAHPICIMLCAEALVKSYKNLTFNLITNKRKSKTKKCNICNKNSFVSHLTQCRQSSCQNVAHYYCILKQQWKDDEQENKWVQDLKIYQGNNFDSLQIYDNQVKRYIKKCSLVFYRSIFGQKKITDDSYSLLAYCRNHSLNLSNCFCISVDEDNSKFNWIYCDSCGKWYHFDCEKISTNKSVDEQQYKCRCCRMWQTKIKKKQEPILEHYPRLHFYDYVYIQQFVEKKGYKVSKQMIQLLRKIPFLCSIRYFNQFLKDKNIISRLLKNINFIPIKQKIIEKKNNFIKEFNNNAVLKLPKNVIESIWKMDFLVCSDPIYSINKGKKGEYKFGQILQIFEKYDKRYVSGSNIIKTAIKQLTKYTNSKKMQQIEDSQEQQQKEQIKQATKILKNQIKQLKKVNIGNKNSQIILINFYKRLNSNQLIKQLCKNFTQLKKKSSQILQALFLYQLQEQMFEHTRLNYLYKQYIKLEQSPEQAHRTKIYAGMINRLFDKLSKKVQINNRIVSKQIRGINYKDEDIENHPDFNNFQSNVIVPFNVQQIINKRNVYPTHENIRQNHPKIITKTLKTSIQSQIYLTNMLIINYIQQFFRSLQIKTSSLNRLYRQYPRFREYMINGKVVNIEDNQLMTRLYFGPYVKVYECCKKLLENIHEDIVIQENNNGVMDIDMLKYIKFVQIQGRNIYRFCEFFIQVCTVKLSKLNPIINQVIYDKGTQFLNLLSSRSMIFQCESEYKAAVCLMQKYQYMTHPRIIEIISKNSVLQQILRKYPTNSLDNLLFVDSNICILEEARQYCEQNNLEFRIGKLKYMMRLLECKIQGFRYFPVQYIVRSLQEVPLKFRTIPRPKSIDFCLLKKFMYKMKLLKYPTTDYLYIQLNQLYTQKYQYFNILSCIINTYNMQYTNEPIQVQEKQRKINKNQLLALIKSKENDFVTCRPQEQEIFLICEIYDGLIYQMGKIADNLPNINQSSIQFQYNRALSVHKQISKIPFHIQQKCAQKFSQFMNILNAKITKQPQLQTVQIQLQLQKPQQQQELKKTMGNKKKQLEQTNDQKQSELKFNKVIQQLEQQIQNKPRSYSCEQILSRINKIKQVNHAQSVKLNVINSFIFNSKSLYERNQDLIEKFVNNVYNCTKTEIRSIRNIVEQYKSQPIFIQQLDNLCKKIQNYGQSSITSDYYRNQTGSIKSVNSSFYNQHLNFNQSVNSSKISHKVDQSIKPSQKVKKTKIFFKK